MFLGKKTYVFFWKGYMGSYNMGDSIESICYINRCCIDIFA